MVCELKITSWSKKCAKIPYESDVHIKDLLAKNCVTRPTKHTDVVVITF